MWCERCCCCCCCCCFFFLAFVYAKRFDDRYDKHTNRNVDIKTTNCHIVEGVSENIQDIS